MDPNHSLLSLILSRRFDTAFDSRQFFRVYLLRQINLIQWFSLIAITILLLKHLLRAFDLRRKGIRIHAPPSQSFYGHLMFLAGANPQHYLTGKTSNGQQC